LITTSKASFVDELWQFLLDQFLDLCYGSLEACLAGARHM
jgi:hypothetical protein